MTTNLSTKAQQIDNYQEVSRKDKIAVVSAIEVILNQMPNVPDNLKKQHLLDGLLWVYTEGAGKKLKWRSRYRTKSVLNASNVVEVQHEHVYTRSFIKEQLLSGQVNDVSKFLENHCFACIVSKEEHKMISRGASGLTKYLDAGIEVFDIKLNKWLNDESKLPTDEPKLISKLQIMEMEQSKSTFRTTQELRENLISWAEKLLKDHKVQNIIEIIGTTRGTGSKCHAQFKIYPHREEMSCFDRPPNKQIFPIGKNDFGNMIINENKEYYQKVVGSNESNLIEKCKLYGKRQLMDIINNFKQ